MTVMGSIAGTIAEFGGEPDPLEPDDEDEKLLDIDVDDEPVAAASGVAVGVDVGVEVDGARVSPVDPEPVADATEEDPEAELDSPFEPDEVPDALSSSSDADDTSISFDPSG